jgi:hypothetical protein
MRSSAARRPTPNTSRFVRRAVHRTARFDEYEKWYLGEDGEEAEGTKARYKFPYGDFEKVHRCGVMAAQSRAGQYKHLDVEAAAAHLHGMFDGLRK